MPANDFGEVASLAQVHAACGYRSGPAAVRRSLNIATFRRD
jgi:hypothetical protein